MTIITSSNNWRDDVKGWWLMGLAVALYALGGALALYFSEHLSIAAQGPGTNPPFYFIRNHFVQGACLGITGLMSLMLGLFYWKKYPPYGWMAVWMSILWSGGSCLKSLVILIKTNDLFTPSLSKSPWPTFGDYAGDPLLRAAEFAPLIVGLVVAFLTRPKLRRAQLDAPTNDRSGHH